VITVYLRDPIPDGYDQTLRVETLKVSKDGLWCKLHVKGETLHVPVTSIIAVRGTESLPR
jgi:hypothetical protein